MPEKRNILIKPSHGRPLAFDLYWPRKDDSLPLILFCHGFKGFKDWGHWSHIARAFNDAGVAFAAMNFSHNGTTPDHPDEFVDLEAFGQNNYSLELEDIRTVVDWLDKHFEDTTDSEIDRDHFGLCGHSRGGATTIIYAGQDDRITQLITWASVDKADYAWHPPEKLREWRETGVHYVKNGRTGQDMPIYYQIYEDFDRHREEYDTENTLRNLDIPCLFLHGADDQGVEPSAAERLHAWAPRSTMNILDDAGHVFGGAHPFVNEELPAASEQLVRQSVRFMFQH